MTSASTNKPTYIENALAFVDAPGEWYLDYETGLLTYQAEEGEDPNSRSFIAPVAEQLVAFMGTAEQPLRNPHFEGNTFDHTHCALPGLGYFGRLAGRSGTAAKVPTISVRLAPPRIHPLS